MTGSAPWLGKPSLLLIILLAGLVATTVSSVGGKGIAVYLCGARGA
jgi:hypothetical protein